MMKAKNIIVCILIMMLSCIVAILALDRWVSYTSSPYIYYDSSTLPYRPIGIVLGTAKYIPHGGINPYYDYRIKGALKLYSLNKIDYLLLSGDNALDNYNEPMTMKKDLIKFGVSPDIIVLDRAGFRTLDSIIRANRIFDADNFTIITQDFHCERAIFIAMKKGIKSQCYAVNNPEKWSMIRLREVFARVAAIIDIYILNKQPKYLGEITPIIID